MDATVKVVGVVVDPEGIGVRESGNPPGPTRMSTSLVKRLFSITWPFIVIMLLMLTLSLVGMSMIAATRAYVTGEGFWSKAERDAVLALMRYGETGAHQDHAAFAAALAVPLGDRRARLALARETPDVAAATAGFLAGRNHPDDIPGMIRLFRAARGVPAFERAVATWAEGDAGIERLGTLGARLRLEHERGAAGRAAVQRTLLEIGTTHRELALLEERFSAQLTALSRRTTTIVIAALVSCSIVLLLIGTILSRRILRRGEAVESKERELAAQLQHQASHDALTGLANRRKFERHLELAIADHVAGRGEHAILYLDLDQLKIVNDTCGHPAGDALIRQMSAALQNQLRASDLLARLGGDEFGVLLQGCGLDAAVRIAEAVRREISESRFCWDGRLFPVSVSIGVLALDSTFHTIAEIMSAADRACYMAKDAGRNRVHVYRADDGERRVRQGEMEWVARVTNALEQGQLVLHAQEIRGLARLPGEPFRCEVLLRMCDDDGRLIAPMVFLPAAERFGLLGRIDRWVIEQTCRELLSLRLEAGVAPVCMINLSASSLVDGALIDFIAERLATTGLPPQSLGFELTETAAITNLAKAAQLLRRLKALGCAVALDDYGSGMSSFACLRTLPLDFLKIDGNFVRDIVDDPVDHAMVVSIQNIAHVIGVRTIAEWVENERTLRALTAIGIDCAQGFAVSMPAPLAEVLRQAPSTTRALRVVAS